MIIPRLRHRIPLTWYNAPYPIACYIPFLYLAYLARRPGTYRLRLSLLPVVICALVTAASRFVWVGPSLNTFNWGQCAFAAAAIAKSLEYALNKEGMLKVGESQPGVIKDKPSTLNNPFYDAFELAYTFRGFQWKFGQGVHTPKETRPLQRGPFLRATLLSFIQHFLLLDLLESSIKLFPGVGSPAGGTIFYPNLSPVWRYTVSTLIHTMTGIAIMVGFNMVYSLITFIAVGCFDSLPSSWPPIMDNPLRADSMHSFWAKRWHQLLRQTFLVFGGYPGGWVAGNLGTLFGTFIASGLFHECSMYSMGGGFDPIGFLFFALQGPILILERLTSRIAGRRIGGWPGRLWVYSIMFVGGQSLTNAWHSKGLGGGLVIPHNLSPVRLWLIPIIQERLHIRP